ncbi:MAG: hypothetical protein Q8J89_00160 [Caulobacter sp.]|nr:hypothetical protein [Caulobacter sp.]
MASTTVSDFVIWTKHIHGAEVLVEHVLALRAGETIDLRIDGVVGTWRKMDDGKDGRPTPGLRPLGLAKDHWARLYDSRRGEVVGLEAVEFAVAGVAEDSRPFEPAPSSGKLVRTEESRRRALESFLSLAGQGWRSDGRTRTRDDMHDRDLDREGL